MLPFYPFYWADYSSKTFDLTVEQHGAYMLFLRYIYTTGKPIPNSECFKIAKCLTAKTKKDALFILEKFFILENNFWKNERCNQVISDQEIRHQKRVNSGSKGGKSRWNNDQNSDSNAIAMPIAKDEIANGNQNHNHNHTQIRDLTKENSIAISEKPFEEFFIKLFNQFYPEKKNKVFPYEKLKVRFKAAIKTLGSVQELESQIEDYLAYLEIASWRQKKEFGAWLNDSTLFGNDWNSEKETELKKTVGVKKRTVADEWGDLENELGEKIADSKIINSTMQIV